MTGFDPSNASLKCLGATLGQLRGANSWNRALIRACGQQSGYPRPLTGDDRFVSPSLRTGERPGSDNGIQHMTATTFWSADGRPMSAAQVHEVLYGALPEFFKDEDELRRIRSAPDIRKALLAGRRRRPLCWPARPARSAASERHRAGPWRSDAAGRVGALRGACSPTGRSARPCRSARPRALRDACQ